MDDRFNTIAGWVLFSGVVGLGLTSISSHYFTADKPHRPHEMGYAIEGVEAEGAGGGDVPIATLLASADPAKGEAIFAKCASCHTINEGGANGIGPNLHGVVGEAIGQGVAGFAFSDALKGKGGEWTFDNLNEWLKSPKAFAPGTKMTFAGLSKPEDRANIIAYLNTQGSNLPLPAAPAAPAAGEAPAEGAAPAGDAAAKPADAAAKPSEGAAAAPAAAASPAAPAH
ncbi:c-type cytochrome [Novosphingobium album (ex Liu et al. 2023)]|uniref:Cytochrome c family protein n=1 Tax=Novosphingobium album (ex Liu et al. 2023) TaxID=3031130 RepID=A0ABT5WMZ3_9SPHN|nr:cytochrome c family protein [Novosphingobium album (ex Liu et al. 2023)]MDE8651086.1 cytochrome c family protein [Novosphingobium album (ex Liu et al. 2023)]